MTSSAVHDDPPFFKCDSFSVRHHGRSVGFGRFTETTDSRLTTEFFVNSPFFCTEGYHSCRERVKVTLMCSGVSDFLVLSSVGFSVDRPMVWCILFVCWKSAR